MHAVASHIPDDYMNRRCRLSNVVERIMAVLAEQHKFLPHIPSTCRLQHVRAAEAAHEHDAAEESMKPDSPLRLLLLSSFICRVVTVRAFDAHHCPGSCMFLFEMFEGKGQDLHPFFSMLYSGDFRYDESMKEEWKGIKKIPKLTLLHVDEGDPTPLFLQPPF